MEISSQDLAEGLLIWKSLKNVSLTDLLLAYFIYLNYRETKIFKEILLTNDKILTKIESILAYKDKKG